MPTSFSSWLQSHLLNDKDNEEETNMSFLETDDDKACKWFKKFYTTHYMLSKNDITNVSIDPKSSSSLDHQPHKSSSFQSAFARVRNGKTNFIDKETLNTILKDEKNCTIIKEYGGIVDDADAMDMIVESELELKIMSPENHPVGFILCGIFTRHNCKWISEDSLCKFALAHGSKSITRTGKLIDIFIQQVIMCQAIINQSYHSYQEENYDGDEYCIIRGILDDSKKYLSMCVLPKERPYKKDRLSPQIKNDKNQLQDLVCIQCKNFIFHSITNKDKDEDILPQYILDRYCIICANLPSDPYQYIRLLLSPQIISLENVTLAAATASASVSVSAVESPLPP